MVSALAPAGHSVQGYCAAVRLHAADGPDARSDLGLRAQRALALQE